MTKVIKNKKKGFTVSLEIEVSQETIERALEQTFTRVSKSARIPGFRKGKAPRNVFEKHYGKGVLLKDGISDAVNMGYAQAIQTLSLDVVDYPKNVEIGEYKENEPLIFKCDVDVKPDVKLGKYKGVKVSKDPDSATDEQLNEQVKTLQDNAAEYEHSEEASSDGDMLTINISASEQGTPIDLWTKENMTLKIGLKNFGEDVDKELIGIKPSETKSFEVTYPEDYAKEDVAGKLVSFSVTVVDVRKKQLPPLDDAFAEKVSNKKHSTFTDFKESLKTELDARAKSASEEKLRVELLDKIAEDSKMDIPNGMIESEIDNDIRQYEQQIRQSGGNLQQYLNLIGQSDQQFREQLRPNAEKRVKSTLVLDAIIEKESIAVSDEEIKEEVKKLLPHADTEEKINQEMSRLNLDGFKKMLRQRKAVTFIVENAKISK